MLKWWTWGLIEHAWVPCNYALVSSEFRTRMDLLVADAIEQWLARLDAAIGRANYPVGISTTENLCAGSEDYRTLGHKPTLDDYDR